MPRVLVVKPNASKIEAMENELAALRNQAALDAERIRKLKKKQ